VTSAKTTPAAAAPGPGSAHAGQAAVQAAGLAKSYGSTVALAGLDLHVAAGETVALLGPNGAGKTTTISLLLGLLSPSRGHVRVHAGLRRKRSPPGWSAPCGRTPA